MEKLLGLTSNINFSSRLKKKYSFEIGSSAKGIDFPDLQVDIKVTSISQPQSSCPFSSARQKIYGLGYSLLVFVYEKTDNRKIKKGNLNIKHAVFIEKEKTADYQTTIGLRKIIANSANLDDIISFLSERLLPVDEIGIRKIAEEILAKPPEIGCLTISNALQWRLQYSRAIDQAGSISGVIKVL